MKLVGGALQAIVTDSERFNEILVDISWMCFRMLGEVTMSYNKSSFPILTTKPPRSCSETRILCHSLGVRPSLRSFTYLRSAEPTVKRPRRDTVTQGPRRDWRQRVRFSCSKTNDVAKNLSLPRRSNSVRYWSPDVKQSGRQPRKKGKPLNVEATSYQPTEHSRHRSCGPRRAAGASNETPRQQQSSTSSLHFSVE